MRQLRVALVALASLVSFAGCAVDSIYPATPAAKFGGAFSAVAGIPQPFNASASTDRQNEPLTYAWDFGDGSTGTGVSPTHVYAMVGSVAVTLTVTDTSSLSSKMTAAGVVAPGIPVANAGGPYTGIVGAAMSFTGSGSTDPQVEALTYLWDFGDGSTKGSSVNPSHTYAMPGTYTVSLTVTDTSNLSASAIANATVATTAPVANAGGQYAGTVGMAVSFSAGGSTDPQGQTLRYTWSFGDGSATVTGISPSHTYAMPGIYTVSLTATNTGNLSATATAKATIAPAAPVARAGGPYAGTVGMAVNFSGSGSADPQGETLTCVWSFGDGGTGSGISPSHTYAMPGTYTVSLTVTNTSSLGATANSRATIAAAAPVASAGGPYAGTVGTAVNFSGGGSADPQGETLTYAWNFGDGSAPATGVIANHTYLTPGTYTVSVNVTDTSNLSASATVQANIAAAVPVANAGGPYAGTAGAALSFSGSGSSDPQGETLSYAWNFGDGIGGSGASPSHTYTRAGSYIVSLSVTNSSGLSGTATAQTRIAAGPPTGNTVMAGSQPISNSSVQLYAVGAGGPPGSVPLLAVPAVTDQTGGFTIAGLYTCPSPGAQVYLTATGGNPGLAPGTNNAAISLMAALGSCANLSASSAYITVDEASTVVAVWPASAFMSSSLSLDDADPRIVSNAFVDSANLASFVAGTPTYPGIGIPNQDLEIRSLANSLHPCVSSNGDTSAGSPCGLLFAAATPAGGSVPADTASAALAIALNPASSVSAIYFLAPPNPSFQPALPGPPTDWTLGLPRFAPATFSSAFNRSTVFMGDSITNEWPLPDNNRGIGGQRASQMLARFSTDVLGHGYARVVILAGTNDIVYPIAGSDQALQQIETMAQMGRAAGIEVILCELPPITGNPGFYHPLEVSLNAALADFAMSHGYLLVDFYSPMLEHPEYIPDGLHPNATGYAMMEAALSSVVEQ